MHITQIYIYTGAQTANDIASWAFQGKKSWNSRRRAESECKCELRDSDGDRKQVSDFAIYSCLWSKTRHIGSSCKSLWCFLEYIRKLRGCQDIFGIVIHWTGNIQQFGNLFLQSFSIIYRHLFIFLNNSTKITPFI